MTAHADKIVAEGGGEQQLDGGEPETNEDLPHPEGVAPNGDNFVWKFRD